MFRRARAVAFVLENHLECQFFLWQAVQCADHRISDGLRKPEVIAEPVRRSDLAIESPNVVRWCQFQLYILDIAEQGSCMGTCSHYFASHDLITAAQTVHKNSLLWRPRIPQHRSAIGHENSTLLRLTKFISTGVGREGEPSGVSRGTVSNNHEHVLQLVA